MPPQIFGEKVSRVNMERRSTRNVYGLLNWNLFCYQMWEKLALFKVLLERMAFISVILVITVYTVWRVKLMQIAMD